MELELELELESRWMHTNYDYDKLPGIPSNRIHYYCIHQPSPLVHWRANRTSCGGETIVLRCRSINQQWEINTTEHQAEFHRGAFYLNWNGSNAVAAIQCLWMQQRNSNLHLHRAAARPRALHGREHLLCQMLNENSNWQNKSRIACVVVELIWIFQLIHLLNSLQTSHRAPAQYKWYQPNGNHCKKKYDSKYLKSDRWTTATQFLSGWFFAFAFHERSDRIKSRDLPPCAKCRGAYVMRFPLNRKCKRETRTSQPKWKST